MPASATKNNAGSGWKPSAWENGEKGKKAPTATTVRTAMIIDRLGRLCQNGIRRVRITNTTRVCVASDSTNQPDRNRDGLAWKPYSMMAKVVKSNTELIGPKN